MHYMTENLLRVAIAVFVLAAVVLSTYDLREHRLPNRIMFPAQGAVALFAVLVSVSARSITAVQYTAISGASLGAVFYLIAFITGGKLGWGDVKYAVLLGGVLGLAGSRGKFGAEMVFLALPLMLVLAGALGILLGVFLKYVKPVAEQDVEGQSGAFRKFEVPYGVSLSAATVVILLAGVALNSGLVRLPFNFITSV